MLAAAFRAGSTTQLTVSVQSDLVQRGPLSKTASPYFYPPTNRQKSLDLGCGYGGILYFLREAGYTSDVGVDVSEGQVELARQLGFKGLHSQDLREFLKATADETYKVIIAFDILEHFTKP